MITDMSQGRPAAILWRFTIPMLLSAVFQQLYNVADSVVAGRFVGEDALAAVGASFPITMIFMAVALGSNTGCSVISSVLSALGFWMGTGGSSLVSLYLGAREKEKAHCAASTGFFLALGLGGVIAAGGLLALEPLMRLLGTPENVFADSQLYLNVYIGGLTFLFLYNICTGVFTALGDSRTPLYFLIGSSISNILLDIFFVVWLKMGVAGVAWATFAAQGAASVLAFLTLLHRIKQLRSTEPYAKFSAEMLVQVTIVAIPSILQQCFVSVGNLFVQSAVNSYGSAVVAGFSACQKLNTFAVTCMTTLSNGVSSFTAQNLGADKKERISEGFRAGTLLGILVCVPFFLFYFFFGRTAMGLFLDESSAAAIQAGVDYMHIVTPFYFIVTIKVMCDGVLRGGSAMLYFMTTTFTDLFLRVALAFLFAKGLGLGATGIWMAWPFGWTLSALLSIFFYRLKPWLKKEL